MKNFFFLVFCCFCGAAIAKSALDETIRSLYSDVSQLQWNSSTPYVPPFSFGHDAGKFLNTIHLNFNGPNATLPWLRRNIIFPDNNMFVNTFFMEALYEASHLSPDLVALSDANMSAALLAILPSKDPWRSPDTPIFGFWPWKEFQNSAGISYWRQWCMNLDGAAVAGYGLDDLLELLLDTLGLHWVYQVFIEPLSAFFANIVTVFNIPSDADDTSTLLALQRHLVNRRADTPITYDVWALQGFNPSEAFSTLVEYSYCPVSNDSDANTIDSRSYYWAREYINTLTSPMDCLVATWVSNITLMKTYYRNNSGVPVIPLNVNNLDPTVGANTLFAMSTSLLMNQSAWLTQSQKSKTLYTKTAEFVAWCLAHQHNQTRPDLELMYYPPVVNVFWFVARHVQMIETFMQSGGSIPFVEMKMVYDTLSTAVRTHGVKYFEGTRRFNASCGGYAVEEMCWDGFLGQGDSPPTYDDRFYTTAVVLNTLLDAFTFEETAKRRWLPGTPGSVIHMATAAATHLIRTANLNTTSYMNAFFSGSVKTAIDLPVFLPPNRIENMTSGEVFTCDNVPYKQIGIDTLWGVQGQMSEAEYNQILAKGCNKIPMLTNFTTLNTADAFPFWSSEGLSKAVAMNALSKFRALV